MKIGIELKGIPTETHCSQSSSINPCNYLNIKHEKCKLFNGNLEYDFDAHAYIRCWSCYSNEIKEIK